MHWNPLELIRIMYYPTLHFKDQEGQGGQGKGSKGGRGERGGARGARGTRAEAGDWNPLERERGVWGMHWNPLELSRIMYYPTLHFKGQEGKGGKGSKGGQGSEGGFGHALESIRIK